MVAKRETRTLLCLIFVFLCSLLHSSTASARLHRRTTLGIADSGDFDGLVPWETRRRNLADDSVNTSLVLAAERTKRRDPLDGFKKYTGGWNITNRHYWASVGFTAAPLFLIAAAWFAIFGLTLFFVCLCYCCCRRDPYGYSRLVYALSLIFLIVFIIAAIVGGFILYTGEEKFNTSATKTIDYVVDQSLDSSGKLRNLSVYLRAAKHIGLHSVTLPEQMKNQIDDVNTKINSIANKISDQASSNAKKTQHVFNDTRLSLIILGAVMLSLIFLGFLSSFLGMQCLVYCLVTIGWILVTSTFLLSGMFLLLHNAITDTCVAMDEWVHNSTARTALDEILPCVDNATAHDILVQTKDVTHRLVSLVNTVINDVSNEDLPPEAGQGYFNQSGPLMPTLCNPYGSDHEHSTRHCGDDEAELSSADEVWKKYVCKTSSSGICGTVGRMTPTLYEQMKEAANVSYGLARDGPLLVEVVDCTFVRETFSEIRSRHCPSLRRHSRWIYFGLAIEAGAAMLSLIFWIVYVRERRHRVYTKRFLTD